MWRKFTIFKDDFLTKQENLQTIDKTTNKIKTARIIFIIVFIIYFIMIISGLSDGNTHDYFGIFLIFLLAIVMDIYIKLALLTKKSMRTATYWLADNVDCLIAYRS